MVRFGMHSMTGFGTAQRHHESRVLVVEAKSVNHRFCDVRLNVPRDLEKLVPDLEGEVRRRVHRGRVEVSVVVTLAGDAAAEPAIDVARARGIMDAYAQLAAALERPVDVALTTIAQFPGVMRAPEVKLDPEADVEFVRAAVVEAVDGLVRMRRREGEQLGVSLTAHLGRVAQLRQSIGERMPVAVAERQAKLRKRVDELLEERALDEGRVAQEVALLADRADVTEELERLDSHVGQFRRLTEEAGAEAVGRKLDFLLQEMNREANTVGSKCSDAVVAHQVVDLKAELERLREQVQNVE